MSTATAEPVAFRSESWRKLTRRDLAAFDDHATDIVLTAMTRGAVGRISRRGHAILRNGTGETMGVSPKSNKSQQVTRIRLRTLFPEPEDEPTTMTSTSGADTPERAEPKASRSAPETSTPALFPCTNKKCDQTFVTEGARYSHVHSVHHTCDHAGCLASFDRAQDATNHRRIAHEGVAPRRGTGKTTKKAAAKKVTAKRKASSEKAPRGAAQVPPQALAAPPEGEHTPAESTGAQTGAQEVVDVTPSGLAALHTPTKAGTVHVVAHDRPAAPDAELGAAIARLDDWVTSERRALLDRIDQLEARLRATELTLAERDAKLALLKEAFQDV